MPRADHPAAIEARHLTKRFGPFVATSDLIFQIPKGEIVALVGPAGAGKTTTVRMLTAFTAPTSGSAYICGDDVQESRLHAMSRLGYLPESGPHYADMTPTQMLRFFGEARRMDRAVLKRRLTEVVDGCGIADSIEKPMRKLSRALRQRVALAQALLHDPDVLIMDEPMADLDQAQVRQFRELLRPFRGRKTILVATATLADLESIVDRVLLLQAGRLIFDGTPAAMEANAQHLSWRPTLVGRQSS